LPHYPADADDIAFLLCAWNGLASHLVSYDIHALPSTAMPLGIRPINGDFNRRR
jgi:hypothetical protein